MNLVKNFDLGESRRVQFKVDFLNTWNHPHFGNPNINPTSGNFGRVTGMWGLPRAIQFNLQIHY